MSRRRARGGSTPSDPPCRARRLEADDVPACEALLARLPDWFGLEEQNLVYVESLRRLPAAVAVVDGTVASFLALESHTPESVEIGAIGCGLGPRARRPGGGA